MMHPPGLQISLRHCVILTFDLVTPQVDRFMPLPGTHVPSGIKVGSFVFKLCSEFQIIVFRSSTTDEERTDERTD